VFVAQKARMELSIYSIAERPVLKLSADLGAMVPSGEKYKYTWSLRDVANGVYFAVVKVNYTDGTGEKKILKIAVLR